MAVVAAVVSVTGAVAAWWPWLLAGAVIAALLYGVVWLLWWRLPKRQMRSVTAADPKDRADIEDNFRKTIGQLLGGAAVLCSHRASQPLRRAMHGLGRVNTGHDKCTTREARG